MGYSITYKPVGEYSVEVSFTVSPEHAKSIARELMLIGNLDSLSPRPYRHTRHADDVFLLCAITDYLEEKKRSQQYWFDEGVLIGLS